MLLTYLLTAMLYMILLPIEDKAQLSRFDSSAGEINKYFLEAKIHLMNRFFSPKDYGELT